MAMRKGRTSLQRGTVLAAALGALSLACVPRAHAEAAPVDLQVVDRETGQPLKVWRHDGRLYVAGAPGDRYALRVTNETEGRILVVMSVDGVNILTGETAGYDQRGYIFAPHETYDLDGWRKSLSEVAAFTFARLPRSYAALTGRPENVGVIGVAVFDEKAVPVAAAPPPAEDFERGAADSAKSRGAPPPLALRAAPMLIPPSAPAPSPASRAAVGAFTGERQAEAERDDEKLGTGHGDREWSVTTIEPFERATPYPQFTQAIEYDTRDHLVALGVIPAWRYGEAGPRPFPSSAGAPGFVPDPPDDP
jgi:hypothetical protein